MAVFRYPGLVGAFWDKLQRVFVDGLYHCAKFGCNHCSGFNDSMEVCIFCVFDIKMHSGFF